MTSHTLINRVAGFAIHTHGSDLGVATRANQFWGRARLPTEPIGTMMLTLTNVVPGSTYDVEVAGTGEPVMSGSAAASSVTLAVPVYQPGSASNDLRIKLRKASAAPYYQSYETQTTAAVGAQSIFINQLTDE